MVEEIASIYKLLLRKIRTRENGPAVESMNRMGLKYDRNFGVGLNELKEFAKEYVDNQEFALFLWQKKSREAKLLSLMIAKSEDLSKAQIENYILGINNIELAEQAAINLLSEIPDNINYAISWCKSPETYTQLTGLLVISQIAFINKDIHDDEFLEFFELFPQIAKGENFHLKRGLSRALLQIGKRNTSLKTKVLQFTNSVNGYNKDMASWLKEEVDYYLQEKL